MLQSVILLAWLPITKNPVKKTLLLEKDGEHAEQKHRERQTQRGKGYKRESI